jgi:hypothetical protein
MTSEPRLDDRAAAPTPTIAEDRRSEHRRFAHRRDSRRGTARHVGLDPGSRTSLSGRAARDAHLVDLDARTANDRLRDVPERERSGLEDRARRAAGDRGRSVKADERTPARRDPRSATARRRGTAGTRGHRRRRGCARPPRTRSSSTEAVPPGSTAASQSSALARSRHGYAADVASARARGAAPENAPSTAIGPVGDRRAKPPEPNRPRRIASPGSRSPIARSRCERVVESRRRPGVPGESPRAQPLHDR